MLLLSSGVDVLEVGFSAPHGRVSSVLFRLSLLKCGRLFLVLKEETPLVDDASGRARLGLLAADWPLA